MFFQQRIATTFDRADLYHQEANTQRRVARRLAAAVADFDLPDRPRILEIGCGTGFLSRYLIEEWPTGRFLFTDIAPTMVDRCREHLGNVDMESVDFSVMDGENLQGDGSFDLIVSSLAFQWFDDPLGNLDRLCQRLAPGGTLAFMTLGEQTFFEWRELCRQHQIPCGLHRYPDRGAWEGAWPTYGAGRMIESRITEQHRSPQTFLQGLKKVGTALPSPRYRPLPSGKLRRVLRSYAGEKNRFSITYHLLFGCFTKAELDT
jgi:malonyl-CoA O-methyltransferase